MVKFSNIALFMIFMGIDIRCQIPTSQIDSIKTSLENRTNSIFGNSNLSSTRSLTVDNPFIDNLSDQIRTVLKHYQQESPIGLPTVGNIITEPIYIPDVVRDGIVTGVNGEFYNMSVWGLSNFTIESVELHLDQLEAIVTIHYQEIVTKGDYKLNYLYFGNSEGPFNITVYNITGTGFIDLEIDEAKRLFANKSSTDMNYSSLDVNLVNVTTLLQTFSGTCGTIIMESEKSHILSTINDKILSELNKRLVDMPQLPIDKLKVSPVDMAVVEGRRYVRDHYEPFVIPRIFDEKYPFFQAKVGPLTISGLSNFSRVGDVKLAMDNNTVMVGLRIFTRQLVGNCQWFYAFSNVPGLNRTGSSNFTIEHLQFQALVHQSVDARKSPILKELQVETGAIYVKMDGQGRFDYLVELGVKMLPKMIRYVITDALEKPIKQKVQTEVLDKVNVQDFLNENMPEIKAYLVKKLNTSVPTTESSSTP